MIFTFLVRPLTHRSSSLIFALLAPLTLLTTSIATTGCTGEFGTTPDPVDCEPLSSRTCNCDDGGIGVQTCGSAGDRWDSCRCSCTPSEVEECDCLEGLQGYRECAPTGEYWLACQCLEEGEEYEHVFESLHDERCGVGEAYCPDVGCVNLANDADNCGMCGRLCEGCDRCYRGACTDVPCDG
jgi:hypothetical protein